MRMFIEAFFFSNREMGVFVDKFKVSTFWKRNMENLGRWWYSSLPWVMYIHTGNMATSNFHWIIIFSFLSLLGRESSALIISVGQKSSFWGHGTSSRVCAGSCSEFSVFGLITVAVEENVDEVLPKDTVIIEAGVPIMEDSHTEDKLYSLTKKVNHSPPRMWSLRKASIKGWLFFLRESWKMLASFYLVVKNDEASLWKNETSFPFYLG